MPSAVFGDFLVAAREHLKAAVAVRADEISWPSAAAEELSHLVTVMSRYCDDLAPCDEIEASGRDDLHPWERAAIDAGAALRIATGCLRRAAVEAADHPVSETAPQRAPHLAAAAANLEVGRDLLHTHLAIDPDGLTLEKSEWASAVTSVPVTRALVNEVGQWSLRLASFTSWVADPTAAYARSDGPGQTLPVSVRTELATASQWLQAAGAAIRPALKVDQVRPADAELLCVIPAAMVPQRLRPDPAGESVAELCDGIAISASRLRGAMRGRTDRTRWSPSATSGGWQWMAQAAGVTSHLSELALRALATRVGQLAEPPVSEAHLSEAASFMVGMRAAWHQADRMWDGMITENRMLPTQDMADASDLVLRMGRLVWDDPHWTPARSRRAPHRNPAVLAPERDTMAAVVAAVHQSVDALARLAKADMDAVEAASQAGRLYVPTRSLPDDYDIPRPFATAPASLCQVLHEAYRIALDGSVQGAQALDGLAIAVGAPSTGLALARVAASAQSRRRGSQPRPGGSIPTDPTLSDTPFRNSRVATGRPGRVEKAIRARHVYDPVVLIRAAAIDNAARQLTVQAGNASPASSLPDTPTTGQRSASNSAQLAAQSFPDDLTARPAAAESPGPARRAASPGSRVPRRVL